VALSRALYHAFVKMESRGERKDAERLYFQTKELVATRTGRFGIVNNRVFRGPDRLVVPYMVGDTLVAHSVEAGNHRELKTWKFSSGRIITDDLLKKTLDLDGDVIDLETEIFDLDMSKTVEIRVTRIRDIMELLRRSNEATNRNEAIYSLRFLVAQLCSPSFKGFLGTKNLQPEVRNLVSEVVRFLNTPVRHRVPMLSRFLVRNISGIVVKPTLIDSLWNDAIDLSEQFVRGSDTAKELRRSTHHGLGDRTRRLARCYRDYLDTGDAEGFARLGLPGPAPADEQARNHPEARRVLDRMVENLEKLLGTTEIITQIRDWQDDYRTVLLACDVGSSLQEEADVVVERGIRERNRWIYLQHLRVLGKKAAAFSDLGGDFGRRIEALIVRTPDQAAFDVRAAVESVRAWIEDFIRLLFDTYMVPVFEALETVVASYRQEKFFEAFNRIHSLRGDLAIRIHRGGFPEQRYLLCVLDCLVEKMSFLSLRHVATEYEEKGVRLNQCLEIIQTSILNLEHDGLVSREVADLAGMLTDGNKTYGELSNVLEHLQRNYHKSLRRVTAPFEKMQARLGFDDSELRIALANMQRYMHDHNSMVNFCDLARDYIRDHVAQRSMRIGGHFLQAPTEEEVYDFLHLSHRERIVDLVRNHTDAANLREQYGGKGSSLLYLSHLRIPTRDAFVIPTTLPQTGLHIIDRPRLEKELADHLHILERDISKRDAIERRFGDPRHPLLLAVRSGSVFSMPGILFTIVFVGMNDTVAEALAEVDPWHAYDSFRRFLASYAQAVWGVDMEEYHVVEDAKRKYGVEFKYDLPGEAMKEVAEATRQILVDEGFGADLETVLADPLQQLFQSVQAILDSWNKPRAQQYRKIKGICHTWQTAAIVQEMASGNRKNPEIGRGMDETRISLTGVIPRTRMTERGVRAFTGEIKFSAAGDDLVGGVMAPDSFQTMGELESLMPMLNRRLGHIITKLLGFMGSDQEVEFTVERGVLSILQTRAAEIMGTDEVWDAFEEPGTEATRGIGIRGGGFRGLAAFDAADLKVLSALDVEDREDVDGVLMILENPTPDDIPLILSADSLLAARGGNTSHAAVAVHAIEEKGYSAVMGARGLQVDEANHEAVICGADGAARHRIRKGDVVSIHGTTGEVYIGTRALFQESRDA